MTTGVSDNGVPEILRVVREFVRDKFIAQQAVRPAFGLPPRNSGKAVFETEDDVIPVDLERRAEALAAAVYTGLAAQSNLLARYHVLESEIPVLMHSRMAMQSLGATIWLVVANNWDTELLLLISKGESKPVVAAGRPAESYPQVEVASNV